jgi:hypothetical protein
MTSLAITRRELFGNTSEPNNLFMSDILDRGLLTSMLAGQHSSILNSIRLMQKPSVSAEEWEEELAKQQISKEDMNNLVMDFLVSEECKEAAESFQEEANVTSKEEESNL